MSNILTKATVLILNRNWQAINIRTPQEAFCMMAGNKNSFNDWLRTAINSIRGHAIEALLNLALRQKNAGKEIEPWIFELIRTRLELANRLTG